MNYRFDASRGVAALKRRWWIGALVFVFVTGFLGALTWGSGTGTGSRGLAGELYALWEESSQTWVLSEEPYLTQQPVLAALRHKKGEFAFADGVCVLRLHHELRSMKSILGVDTQTGAWTLNYMNSVDWPGLPFLPVDALPQEDQLIQLVCDSDLVATLPQGTRRQDSVSVDVLLNATPAGVGWRYQDRSIRPAQLAKALAWILSIALVISLLVMGSLAYSAGLVWVTGCQSCGYDLRGLPLTGACPECGNRQRDC